MTDLILSHFLSDVHLSVLLILLVSPDCLATRAIIGLIDRFGLALLVGCLPLPISLRWTTARAFSEYRTVLGTGSLNIIPVIAVLVFRTPHVFCFRLLIFWDSQ